MDDLQTLHAVLAGDTVGKKLKASIVRGGELTDVTVVVGERQGGRK